jgi:hypothetical protein
MNEDDRDLLMLLGSAGNRISAIVTGLFEDSLTCDEQIDFANQLIQAAERFCRRVHRTPLIVEQDQA